MLLNVAFIEDVKDLGGIVAAVSSAIGRFDPILGEGKSIDYQEYRMMTSVSVPAFDKRTNNETEMAELLGVAGADISMEQFYSLTYPYKTGANGYTFIVNNNGYLLMHPDLRPVYDGTLKINYNSIDLAEVEFFDGDDAHNIFNSDILSMRQSMVDQKQSEYLEKPAKFHYDDMQRVGIEKRNYYIRPLANTPFSMGLVLPSDFGVYQIRNSPSVESGGKSTVDLREPDKYLKMKNSNKRDSEWIIHPDWTYCKYRFPTHKFFTSKEEELLHFLEKMNNFNWQWSQQYEEDKDEDHDDGDFEEKCKRPGFKESDYFCDRDLVELLMVDAKILENFRDPILLKNDFDMKLMDIYKPTLRFASTQSGLTKWQNIPEPKEGEDTSSDFISAYPRSMDEPWYRMAVLQHQTDEESFTFSVPHKSNESNEIYVVAAHAIFHKKTHDGKKAPAAVVGYLFEQNALYDRFMEITSETDRFTLPCHSDARKCYILDSNAYVIISSGSANETGHFFGESEPFVMSYLVERGIYKEKKLFDYQGLCIEEIAITNKANYLMTPWILFKNLFQYILVDIFWNYLCFQIFAANFVLTEPLNDFDEFRDYDSDETIIADEDYEAKKEEVFNATVRIERNTWPCHKNKTLYILQQHVFSEEFIYGVRHNSSRFRFANRIAHTNLILVVLNTLYGSTNDDNVMSIEPNVLPLDDCRESHIYDLPRRRLSKCFTHHSEEMKVGACGEASLTRTSSILILFGSVFLRKANDI